jgi:hypothetical protein
VLVSVRPLVFVSGLTLGDYALWNWSLNHNHDVLALISGLTLPPLGVACLWLLALTAMRLLARFGRRPARGRASAGAASDGGTAQVSANAPAEPARHPRPAAPPLEEAPTAASAGRSSSRLAA